MRRMEQTRGGGSPTGGRHCSWTVDWSLADVLNGSRSNCLRRSAPHTHLYFTASQTTHNITS